MQSRVRWRSRDSVLTFPCKPLVWDRISFWCECSNECESLEGKKRDEKSWPPIPTKARKRPKDMLLWSLFCPTLFGRGKNKIVCISSRRKKNASSRVVDFFLARSRFLGQLCLSGSVSEFLAPNSDCAVRKISHILGLTPITVTLFRKKVVCSTINLWEKMTRARLRHLQANVGVKTNAERSISRGSWDSSIQSWLFGDYNE